MSRATFNEGPWAVSSSDGLTYWARVNGGLVFLPAGAGAWRALSERVKQGRKDRARALKAARVQS